MGAPVGNNNATKNKPWAEALARVNIQSDGAKMRAVAEKVWELAASGDIQAIKEIGDRVDGKAVASTEISGPDGSALPVTINVRFPGS
jgi:hypothetical protein